MSTASIVRAVVGGLIAAAATAIPFAASQGHLTLAQWLSSGLAGLVGTGLTAYSPSASASGEPPAGPLVSPGVIGEVEKVAEEVAPALEAVVPAAAPIVAAVEGALNPGASQLP